MIYNFPSPSGVAEAPPVECVPVEASNFSEGLDVEAAGGDTRTDKIIEFPKLEKCGHCSGSGMTWSFQRRTKRAQVSSSCTACRGTGKVRNFGNHETGKEGL